MVDRNKYLIK